jgi:hypothetical protein
MSRKRVSNDDSLKSPTFDGDITPNDDNKWTLGTPMKRLKAVYASNLVSSLTNFLNIALTATLNQINLGTGTTTTVSAPTPAASQVVTTPDSGTSSTQFILADTPNPQTVNSMLQCNSNLVLLNGNLQAQPLGANSQSIVNVYGFGPEANAVALNIDSRTYLGSPKVNASFLTDDTVGDAVLMVKADSGLYPNAALRMGYSGSGTVVALGRSLLTMNIPLTITNTSNQITLGGGTKNTVINSSTPGQKQTVSIPDSGTSASQFILQDSASSQNINSNLSLNGQITLNPSLSGNLRTSVNLTGTANAAFSVRSFLTGFVSTAGTFLSDSGVSDCVIRNGVTNANIRIGFGTGSASSVVVNSTRSTFYMPVTITNTSNQLTLGNGTITVPAGGARTYTVPDSYQSCSFVTNSIICGLTNTSARPAIAANSTPQVYEIRAFSTTSLSNDDGFLRLRAGGSSFTSSASWIDISGSSTVTDMNRNVVVGAGGAEVARFSTGKCAITGNLSLTGTFTVPAKTGSITYSGAGWSTTLPYSYTQCGSAVTFLVTTDLLNYTFTSAGGLITIPLGDNSLPSPTSPFTGSFHIQVNGTWRFAAYQVQPSGNLMIYKDANFTMFASGDNVFWNPQALTWHL